MGHRNREEKIQPVEALLRRAMPPLYETREKLERAALEWDSVVGPVLARQSAPVDVEKDSLVVAAESPLAGSRVAMMGGNIAGILAERWGIEVVKVKVVVGRLPLKAPPRKKEGVAPIGASVRINAVRVRAEDVKEFESLCFESLPDFPRDAAESFARLRAFFTKRFGRGK
jgi:hypothetical protein